MYIVVKRTGDCELYHHGIKGMKWGVRRFQKKDGSLTAAGKKRYSEDGISNNSSKSAKKSKHRLRLEENYKAKGLSQEEAERAADKRIKVEKTIAIAAGVTVTACAAYYAKNKWVADRTDQVLKAGTTFHNLDGKANPRPGEHLYVNYRQNDRNYFNGKFAVNKMRRTGHAFEHRIEALEDVKIPSLKTRQSTFAQLCEKDPEFKAAMAKHCMVDVNTSPKKIYEKMWQKFGDKDTPYFNEAKAKYFKALKEKGYAAIVDEWDTNPLVFRSDAPLILLDINHKSFGKMTIRELRKDDMLVAQANSHALKFKNNMLNVISAPHTNHFKESNMELNRYYKKDSQNRKYINDVLFKSKYQNGLFGEPAVDVTKAVLESKGKELAYVGKYLEKNKNMSLNEALVKGREAYRNREALEALALLGTYGTVSTIPAYAIGKTIDNRRIDEYRSEHPNTKKTDTEILKMIRYGGV